MATLGNRLILLGFIALGLWPGCGVKDIQRPFTADHANRLLSGDDTKRWQLDLRIADELEVVDPCIADNELVFVKAEAGDSLYILGRAVDCDINTNVDTLYKAKYELQTDADEAFENIILLTEEQYAVIRSITIERLTSSELWLLYSMDGVDTQETYIQQQ